jgi:hypothetical protein
MAPFLSTTRRLILIAVLTLAVAVIGGLAAYSAPRTVADPAKCTSAQSRAAFSLACKPGMPPGGGAPNEQTVTDTNPGTQSPTQTGLFGTHHLL